MNNGSTTPLGCCLKVGIVRARLLKEKVIVECIINSPEEVETSSGFLEYEIAYYIATTTGKAIVGRFPYSNEALQNCSVLMLNLLTFNGQFPVTGNEDEVKPLPFEAKRR